MGEICAFEENSESLSRRGNRPASFSGTEGWQDAGGPDSRVASGTTARREAAMERATSFARTPAFGGNDPQGAGASRAQRPPSPQMEPPEAEAYNRPVSGDRVQMDTCKIRPGLYQFTAIDDCSRFLVAGLAGRQSAHATLTFLDQVLEEMPFPIEGAAEKCRDGGFLSLETGLRIVELCLCSSLQRPSQRPVQIAVENRWMDVAFAADRRRVAQHLCNRLDGLQHIFLDRCLGVEMLKLAQSKRRQIGSTEVRKSLAVMLRRRSPAGTRSRLPTRPYGLRRSRRGTETALARVILGSGARSPSTVCCAGLRGTRTTLAAEIKLDPTYPCNLDVAVPQCGETIALVRLRVFLVADPHQGGLEEAHDPRQTCAGDPAATDPRPPVGESLAGLCRTPATFRICPYRAPLASGDGSGTAPSPRVPASCL
jgi:hypothetical protein